MIPARHLFASWSGISTRLRAAPCIALFLDFDGTLTPFRHRPEDVELSSQMRRVVAMLQRSPRFHVVVISGRRQADVRARMRIPGVRYLGLHGWEGRLTPTVTPETRAMLDRLKSQARRLTKGIPGAWIEDKDVVATVHYADAAPQDAARIREEMTRRVQEYSGRIQAFGGARGFELVPTEVEDKGAAVRREWRSVSRAALPVFVGDDLVDEPAFVALTEGITVRVGSPVPTHAHYRLSGVPEVRRFLQRLSQEVQ
jgi:trehalose-phosphatase